MSGLTVIDVRPGCTEVEEFTCGADVVFCVTGEGGKWLLWTAGPDPEVMEAGVPIARSPDGTDETQRTGDRLAVTQPVSGKIVWVQSLLLLLLHVPKLMKPQEEQVC